MSNYAIGADFAVSGPEDWDAYLSGALGDEIGFEDMSLIGGPAAINKLEAQMGRLRNVDPNAVLVRSEIAKRRRVLDLGMPVVSVAGGATSTITIQTQRTFRTERVYIPDGIAEDFVVTQAFVGQNSQFAGAAPVAAAGWSNKTFDPKGVLWDTANPGIFISLTVQNTSAAAVTWSGSLRGTSTVR